MIVNVILAIAVISVAPGTVTELQFGVADIGATTYGTAMGVSRCLFRGRTFLTELDRSGALGLLRLALGNIGRKGDQVQNILSRKQQEVGKANQGEQVMREEQIGVDDLNGDQQQVNKPQEPGPNGNDKEYQKLCIGMGRGKHQKQTQLQIKRHVGIEIGEKFRGHRNTVDHDRGGGTQDHGECVHQQHTGEKENVESQCAHGSFHMPSQMVEEIESDEGQKRTGGGIHNKGEGHEPPDLTLQDLDLIEAQPVVKKTGALDQCQQIHHSGSDDNIQHQIGNAFVPISQAETVKFCAQVFQTTHLQNSMPL